MLMRIAIIHKYNNSHNIHINLITTKNRPTTFNFTITKVLIILLLLLTGCQSVISQTNSIPTPSPTPTEQPPAPAFNGERAYQDVVYQLSLGSRTVGSPAHRQAGDWIAAELEKAGWLVEIQDTIYDGQPVRNIIGKWGDGNPWVVFGAHYDSRLLADHDPDPQKQTLPVPGANDGASGVAALLELARTLPAQMDQVQSTPPEQADLVRPTQVWLVFLDTEDNGRIPGHDWIMGSRAFVENLTDKPDAAVILDMIGDAYLNIFFEGNSDPRLSEEIWLQAARLGYSGQFIPQVGLKILDDHIPFIEAGIPAVDIIDFDYPYYHTTADTADKVSPNSLQVVGDTITVWLKSGSTIFSRP
jgi:Zn-dependent M28 family amino/carboxypeptidase